MGVEGFLKVIRDITRRDMEAARSSLSLKTLRREAEQTPSAPDFLEAMKQSGPHDIGIVAEFKKASPSQGDIRPDLDPALYAEACTKAGARALSVLTEPHYFKGGLTDLEIICRHTDRPVLRKDFIIDEYQIYEARRAGAASTLLITALLSRNQLKDYILLSRELGMEPLVEIMSERELEIAHACGAAVVDMNNRDLKTLKVDLTVSERIVRILPPGIIPVEASGIRSFEDIEKALTFHIHNFLVGESIVRAEDTESFIRELRNVG